LRSLGTEAAVTPWQTLCLIARANSVRTEIQRIADKDHPYREPGIIYEALKRVVDSRVRTFGQALDLGKGTAGGTRLIRRLFNQTRAELDKVNLELIKAARVDSARIPFEILRALSSAAEALLGERCKTVVRLDPEYNYSIESCEERFKLLQFEPAWQEAVSQGNDAETSSMILLLGFPSADAGVILLHALAAHELGHVVINRWRHELDTLRDELIAAAKARNSAKLQDYVQNAARSIAGLGFGLGQGDAYESAGRSVIARLERIAEAWLEELVADLVAARLVGPAFLAAFDRLNLGVEQASDEHPPSGLRAEIVQSYIASEIAVVSHDAVWHTVYEGKQPPSGSQDLLWEITAGVCREAALRLAPRLRDVTSVITQEARLSELVAVMEEHIENGAPPSVPLAQIDDHDGRIFWLVMYAGWHFRLSLDRFDAFARRFGWQDEPERAEMALGSLMLHALQSLELRARSRPTIQGGARSA
jgi:hypothetical protein